MAGRVGASVWRSVWDWKAPCGRAGVRVKQRKQKKGPDTFRCYTFRCYAWTRRFILFHVTKTPLSAIYTICFTKEDEASKVHWIPNAAAIAEDVVSASFFGMNDTSVCTMEDSVGVPIEKCKCYFAPVAR